MQEPLSVDNALLILIDLEKGAISTIQSMNGQELEKNAIALTNFPLKHYLSR